MISAHYLADTSAWKWSHCVKDKWSEMLRLGDIATCDAVEMEMLWAAKSSSDFEEILEWWQGLIKVPVKDVAWGRALEVMTALARNQEFGHRSAKMLDLIIAATAESAQLTVLHYDADFDLIADVTGQPTEWLAKRGTLKR